MALGKDAIHSSRQPERWMTDLLQRADELAAPCDALTVQATARPDALFLCAPAAAGLSYAPDGFAYRYGEALGRIDPTNAKTYEANRQAFLTRLNAKLTEWESKLTALKGVPMVAYHNSWPYFARRFRLDIIGFIETKPGVPPSPSHLAEIVREMRARSARVVVREPHEPERDVAFVASRAGAKVVTLAASVGALPGADDYISLFDVNVAALTAAAAKR